jgi:hypothetical protein
MPQTRSRGLRTCLRGKMAIMSEGIVVEVANRLWQAEINRSPISPITDAHPELGIDWAAQLG